MLSTGILITEAVRSDRDERAGFRLARLADAFEPLAVFVFDIPNYSNLPVCPTAHTVSLGDLASDPPP
jgi:hypothetical protein